jgi:hypothetical protein
VKEQKKRRFLTPLIISLCCLTCATAVAQVSPQIVPSTPQEELEINLKDPLFKDGVLTTEKGGIVIGHDLRIQATNITFINRIEEGLPVKKIHASGNLFMEYAGKAFVGNELEFDFLTRTGVLWGGKTYIDVWFIGGEKIQLKSDGTYCINNAFLTTSENDDSLWDINAGCVKITKDNYLAASAIRFRFSKIPIMWLPSFKTSLQFLKDPPVRYKIIWDKGLGPRATMRYRIYSWHDFNLYFRVDYRLKRGLGGALESNYCSPDQRTSFITRSYGAYDKSVPDQRGKRRYRLQGLYGTKSVDHKTTLHMSYDKLHDSKMPGDFKSEDFEINTQKQTILWIHHQEDHAFATLRFQPRINNFQSLNQELPVFLFGVKPFTLASTGIISQNIAKAAFLDYVYDTALSKKLLDRHAIRIETKNQIYRPIDLGPATLTPNAGIVAIFYNNNPEKRSVGQGAFTYGADLSTSLYGTYRQGLHTLKPYFRYEGISQPLASSDEVIIFNITDGWAKLNLLRAGLKNTFSCASNPFAPSFSADIFTYAFFSERSFHQRIPKGYLSLGYNQPNLATYFGGAWNFQESLLDYFNIRSEWTINENLALALEFRHRSKYDWRKANKENFILDAARTLSELLESPLSDGRNTILSKLYIRLSPRWTCQIESHHGWGRKTEPSYHAAKIELFTLLTTSWQLKASYEHTPNDDRFGAGISLVK